MMWALDSVSDYLSELVRVTKNKCERKPMAIDCDGCERKVENSVNPMKGAESVELSKEEENRETLNGYVESEKVLKMVTNTEFWPFAQYNLDSYPYVDGVYEHEAPSGYVRNDPQELPISSDPSEILTSLFSDDNPDACSVM